MLESLSCVTMFFKDCRGNESKEIEYNILQQVTQLLFDRPRMIYIYGRETWLVSLCHIYLLTCHQKLNVHFFVLKITTLPIYLTIALNTYLLKTPLNWTATLIYEIFIRLRDIPEMEFINYYSIKWKLYRILRMPMN